MPLLKTTFGLHFRYSENSALHILKTIFCQTQTTWKTFYFFKIFSTTVNFLKNEKQFVKRMEQHSCKYLENQQHFYYDYHKAFNNHFFFK